MCVYILYMYTIYMCLCIHTFIHIIYASNICRIIYQKYILEVLLLFCVTCVHGAHAGSSTHANIKGDSVDPVLSSHLYMGSGDGTQVSRLT